MKCISAAAAAARTVASGLLRFRPRPVFPGHRRLRLCDGRHQGEGAASQRRPVAALRGVHAGLARRDRRAHSQRPGRRQARHRHRAAHRPPRRDLRARQRRDVHLRPRPRALDIRLSHGRRRRRGVLCDPRAAGVDPGVDRDVSDQEMVGGGRSSPRRFTCCYRARKSRRSAPSS